MFKYYDWKIRDNGDDIIWIKQKDDGTLKVSPTTTATGSCRKIRSTPFWMSNPMWFSTASLTSRTHAPGKR